jgi:hypothetical protein
MIYKSMDNGSSPLNQIFVTGTRVGVCFFFLFFSGKVIKVIDEPLSCQTAVNNGIVQKKDILG